MALSVGVSETDGKFMIELDGFIDIVIDDLLKQPEEMVIPRDELISALRYYRDSTKQKYYDAMRD